MPTRRVCVPQPHRQARCVSDAVTISPSPRAVIPSPRPQQPVDGWTFAALHSAIGIAGLFTYYTARRWNLLELADTAERVAVELISRAVETTGIPQPHPAWAELDRLQLISIQLRWTGRRLLIQVWDSDTTPPIREQPRDLCLDGHLLTVEEASQRWDCYQPRNGGKVIWAELALPSPRPIGSQPSPHS